MITRPKAPATGRVELMAMTDRLVALLLRQKQLRGSTGTIVLGEGRIAFYPIGSEGATVSRSILYEKQR